jgi:type I restriction enzyme R subunit
MVDKKSLSERDICTKYITPALVRAGWDLHSQIREEVSFTKGRIIVRGKLHTRGEQKRADYILYFKSNIPLAVIEAKLEEQLSGMLKLRIAFIKIISSECVK